MLTSFLEDRLAARAKKPASQPFYLGPLFYLGYNAAKYKLRHKFL